MMGRDLKTNRCSVEEKAKPMDRASILLSIYKPNKGYLKEQLDSLNRQTYGNLELLVWNDCPDEAIDRELFGKCITRFPVRYFDEKKNLGYVKAFEKLTELAEGDLVSYCDQDDIWEPEKIEKCVQAMRQSGSIATVCDKSLMTADGEVYVRSARADSRMACDHWNTGDDITSRAAFFGYGTGMTIVADRKAVQSFLPLVPTVPHDMQLMLFLSAKGKVAYVDEPLVRYRRHGKNETGMLYGVEKKRDYYETRCKPSMDLMKRFQELFPDYPELSDMLRCAEARMKGNVPGIWKYRRMLPDLYLYEIGLALCPDFVFRGMKNWLLRRLNKRPSQTDGE